MSSLASSFCRPRREMTNIRFGLILRLMKGRNTRNLATSLAATQVTRSKEMPAPSSRAILVLVSDGDEQVSLLEERRSWMVRQIEETGQRPPDRGASTHR